MSADWQPNRSPTKGSETQRVWLKTYGVGGQCRIRGHSGAFAKGTFAPKTALQWEGLIAPLTRVIDTAAIVNQATELKRLSASVAFDQTLERKIQRC